MYALRVADFLALEAMLPHEEMKARGLVVPLSMHGEHKLERVHFISHQWLGFRNAAPQGGHLRCMQTVFAEQS
jgi:hypothetical protein